MLVISQDYSLVTLDLGLDSVPHGKGLWKLNNSLLHDPGYLKCVNDKFDEVKLPYSLPIYNENYVKNEDRNIEFKINDQLFLETLFMEIRGKTICYATYKKQKNKWAFYSESTKLWIWI